MVAITRMPRARIIDGDAVRFGQILNRLGSGFLSSLSGRGSMHDHRCGSRDNVSVQARGNRCDLLRYDHDMVTEDTVEASWREVGAMSPEGAQRHMKQLARRQRELLVFVTTMTENLSEAAQETAIYAFVVICRMFERTCRTSLPKARRRDIVTAYEKINEQLGRLISADERFLERHAAVSTGSEPFVMRYVSEVLLEPDDPEAKLPEDEIGEVFICLQTVADVLHDVAVAE